jgi:hypothetical protein
VNRSFRPSGDVDVEALLVDVVALVRCFVVIHPSDLRPADRSRRGLIVEKNEKSRDMPPLAGEADGDVTV